MTASELALVSRNSSLRFSAFSPWLIMSRSGPLVLLTNRSTLVVDGVLGVAEHVDHELRCGVDEELVLRRLGFLVALVCAPSRNDRRPARQRHYRDRHQRHQRRPAPGGAACAAEDRQAVDSRTLTVFGVSTGTPVDAAVAPLAGPAALRRTPPRRRLRRVVEVVSSRHLCLPWSHHQINPVFRGRQFVSTACEHASSPGRVDESPALVIGGEAPARLRPAAPRRAVAARRRRSPRAVAPGSGSGAPSGGGGGVLPYGGTT